MRLTAQSQAAHDAGAVVATVGGSGCSCIRQKTTDCARQHVLQARWALRVPGAWARGALGIGGSHGGHGGRRRLGESSWRLGGSGKAIWDDAKIPELTSVAMGLVKTLENELSVGRGEKNVSTTHCSIPLTVVRARLALAGGRENACAMVQAGSGQLGQRVDVHRMVV